MADQRKGLFGVFGDLLRKALGSGIPKPKQTPTGSESKPNSVSSPQTRGAPPIRDVDGRVLMDSLIDNTKKKFNVNIPSESKLATAKKTKKQREREEKNARAREESRARVAEIREFERIKQSKAAKPKAPVKKPPEPTAGASSPPSFATDTTRDERLGGVRGEAAWVKTLNHPPPDVAGRPANEVRIGIDFGTSYSKMAIKLLGRTFMVDWTGLCSTENPYLLPTQASELKDGHVTAGPMPGATLSRHGLKVPFLNETATEKDHAWMAAYLSNLLRYARAWVAFHHGKSLARINPRWEVNLGLPAGSWTDKPALATSFSKIGRCAWALSLEESISIKRAMQMMKFDWSTNLPEGLEQLDVVPEFVAQVAAYMESSQRVEGIHLLVDIGGGTLDVACFFVHDPRWADREKIPIYSADVSSLGTNYLMNQRIEAVPGTKVEFSPTDSIPSAEQFAASHHVAIDVLRNVDRKVRDLVSVKTAAVVQDGKVKNYRAPEFAHSGEQRPIRVFVTGGGANVPLYLSGVEQASEKLALHFLTTDLPKLDTVQWAEPDNRPAYNRMSVAAGLTLGLDMLKPISPDEIPSIPPRVVTKRLDHEELYPK
jgi:hypothetical protein